MKCLSVVGSSISAARMRSGVSSLMQLSRSYSGVMAGIESVSCVARMVSMVIFRYLDYIIIYSFLSITRVPRAPSSLIVTIRVSCFSMIK